MTQLGSPELPMTEVLHIDFMNDISLVDGQKAEQRDPDAVIEIVKAITFDTDETTAPETPADPAPVVEAEKAGAAISAKNRGLLGSVRDLISRVLGEGAEEQAPTVPAVLEPTDDPREEMRGPEAGDPAVPSGRLGPLSGVAKAEPAASGAVEEDEMGFTLDELKGAISEAQAPLMQRIEAIETAQKATPVVGTISGEQVAAAVQSRPLDPDAVRDAIAVYEARKAGGFAEAQYRSGAGFPLLNADGRGDLRAIAKATPREQRPSVQESLRILSRRDIYSGEYAEVE